MIELLNKSDCCGCSACYSICQHHAIVLRNDNEGFLYPQFDKEKCVNCGLCEKVCPIINYKTKSKIGNPSAYAAINTNHDQYMQSSSGGIFILLCKYILSTDGIVCGAIYDGKFIVRHSFATTLEECTNFQGSKYVQSDIRGIYPEIKSILKTGKNLLFSGTPCQVEGLKLYLQKHYDNLFTVDLICHGVPSPLVFHDYLNFIRNGQRIVNINMKSKTTEKGTAIKIEFSKGKSIRQTLKTDLWNKLYFGNLIVRPSCHYCQFTNYNRTGDMTIGDSWGINKYYPDFHPKEMTSLIFLNTIKGHALFNGVQSQLDFIQIKLKESLQPQLQYPTRMSPIRDIFWKDYQRYGFYYIAKKYLDYSFIAILKEKIKNCLHGKFS